MKASGPPSLAHTRSPCGLGGGAWSPRRSPDPRAHREQRRPLPKRTRRVRRGAVLGRLRASPARGGDLGRASANPHAAPCRSLPAPPTRPLPSFSWPPRPSYRLESRGRAADEGKHQRSHPRPRAAGLRPTGGGHAGMAGRRGQGGSLPPQDLFFCPGHSGPAEIHPRCAPRRAPCSPGSQEKFGRGRSGERRQLRGPGPPAGAPW